MTWDGFQREALKELGCWLPALVNRHAPNTEITPSSPPPQETNDPPLLRALLRAAAADHRHVDVLALCWDWMACTPSPSAQARRALWPTLRRLRRQAPA